MLVLLGGSGFFLFKAHSDYSTSTGSYKRTKKDVEELMAKPIYPKKENLEALVKDFDEFEAKVDALHTSLQAFQQPLNDSIDPTQFPQQLRGAIEEFRAYAIERRVVVPDNFYLGMNAYEEGIPKKEATGILNFELEAIQFLLRMIIDSGADEIYSLSREETPQERGEPNPELESRVVKYTLQVSFEIEHGGFQNFLNQISNEKEYFFVTRVLRIDNEEKFGPPRNVMKQTVVKDPETGQVVTEFPTDSEGNIISGDKEYIVEDASVIFGNEKLCVTAILDLCRFPNQSEPGN